MYKEVSGLAKAPAQIGGIAIFEFMKRSDRALNITSDNCKPRDRAYLFQYEEALKVKLSEILSLFISNLEMD